MKQEYAYWMALAHLPQISNRLKNDIIVNIFRENISIIDFFRLDRSTLESVYKLDVTAIALIEESKKELANYSFIVEDLFEQGYDIIPITSEKYSGTLKNNLKRTYAPPLIYVKGNQKMLKEQSMAIVGSRNASGAALRFTDNVALEASKNCKVVVSGFAKGVDKQALDSAIKYNGQSMIVLPQGIMTFASGFKKYYPQIISGDVLVLSAFFPKAPWNVKLAMARNPIIYGLADEIFVAESSDKGGTWAGVIDGLRKGRKIFVRVPEKNEKNANQLLINQGAVPVDSEGNIVEQNYELTAETPPVFPTQKIEAEKEKVFELLKGGEYSSKEIIQKLKLDLNTRQLTSYLKTHDEIKTINSKPLKFTIAKQDEYSLFNQGS